MKTEKTKLTYIERETGPHPFPLSSPFASPFSKAKIKGEHMFTSPFLLLSYLALSFFRCGKKRIVNGKKEKEEERGWKKRKRNAPFASS